MGREHVPQATEELRAEWGGPTGCDDSRAIAFLQGRGYKLTNRWTWKKPRTLTPSLEDRRAVLYLIQEWDMGGMHD